MGGEFFSFTLRVYLLHFPFYNLKDKEKVNKGTQDKLFHFIDKEVDSQELSMYFIVRVSQ